jgi:Tetratricopeptide repeat
MLVFVLGDQGDFAGARSLFEHALEGFEKALGPEHPDNLLALRSVFEMDFMRERKFAPFVFTAHRDLTDTPPCQRDRQARIGRETLRELVKNSSMRPPDRRAARKARSTSSSSGCPVDFPAFSAISRRAGMAARRLPPAASAKGLAECVEARGQAPQLAALSATAGS